MTSLPYYRWLPRFQQWSHTLFRVQFRQKRLLRPPLDQLAQRPDALPRFVRASPVAMRYLRFLGVLDWSHFPERDLGVQWTLPPIPFAPFVAACLVKLNEQIVYMPKLYDYLVDHPALVYLSGFPLVPSRHTPWGFDVQASLPTKRHLTRMLRKMPNSVCQYLLDETVRLLHAELSTEVEDFGQAVSLDIKHILAWVRENNRKDYVPDRYDKTKQPTADPDCRLGCKRRRNQRTAAESSPPTPTSNPRPPTISVGEYLWGYASGVVAIKVPDWGEFVLAELTLPFNEPDVAYFFPLMEETERRLGFRPKYGAFDAAYDAFYVYEHFHRENQPIKAGFAAVPRSRRGGKRRQFDPEGLPLCKAGLAMPLKYTYTCKTTRIEHERGRHHCPLVYLERTDKECPIGHKNWPKGCITTIATSVGARIRHQLDRESALYKEVYKQRTATERINSQAKALGIERPKLRNRQAITNQNTLIYVLINLRALHRVRQRKEEKARA